MYNIKGISTTLVTCLIVCIGQAVLAKFAEFYFRNAEASGTPFTHIGARELRLATFEQRGKGTIDLALENPNLFRFLYTGERSQLLSTGFELQTNRQDVANMYQEMAELLGITPKQVMDFAMTMMVYTQGIGTLIASGIVRDTKENMYHMLHNTGMTYLKGLGVKDSTLWDLSGGDRSDESSSNG